MASNKILTGNAERLGIRDAPTIRKSEAFLRALNSKPSKTINDSAKVILCLDLAATHLGTSFDKETALRLTGLRKNVYQNNLNNLEKILNLDKPLTVSELCVQFSCPEVKETAAKVLQSYKETDTKIKDIGHPQYVAAAVFTSCKLHGVKVDKSQLKTVSRLKAAQWNELLEEFNKFSSALGLKTVNKKERKKVENDAIEDDMLPKAKIKEKEEVVEEYAVWRERILKEATAEILKREMED